MKVLIESAGRCSEAFELEYGKDYFRIRNPILETDEVNAINEKCKELGWL